MLLDQTGFKKAADTLRLYHRIKSSDLNYDSEVQNEELLYRH